MKLTFVLGLMLLWGISLGHADLVRKDEPNGENVFIITLDGYRWQELFSGADPTLISNNKWTSDTTYNKALYWSSDPKQRRERLMPFFWNVVAKQGQLYGNRATNSKVNNYNLYLLSYPGYNEIFTGEADPFIASNNKVMNKNTNLLEYISKAPGYVGKVAAFTSWDAFPYILNKDRSKFYLNSAHNVFKEQDLNATEKELKILDNDADHSQQPTRDDRITFLSAKEYIKKNLPKVVFLGLSGTDDAGHAKQYDQYLKSANEADRIISELWSLVQSMPQYKGKTTFIITTDHGRGDSEDNWYDHGLLVRGSSQTWMALLGSNVKPLGECTSSSQLYQRNIAGTISYLLGLNSYTRHMLPLTFFEGTSNALAKN